MKNKIRVGVIFGGRSAEHEVSLVSAASIIHALNKDKYEVLPIGITAEGRWLFSKDAVSLLKEKSTFSHLPEHVLTPDPQQERLVPIGKNKLAAVAQSVDVFFPILHGTYGEDGSIQGLFELADVPYVGAGVLASAIGMDKVVQKQLLQHADIPVAPFVSFLYAEYLAGEKKWISLIQKKLSYPCFVKPANLGSSIGISKAKSREQLKEAIVLAAQYDRKIIVEKGINHAREIECSVLGNDHPIVSMPGEVIPSNEFYDYDAKYVDGKSTAIIPAKLPKAMVKKIQKYAIETYRVLDCEGMARVDFLVQRNNKQAYVSELNTIPGFTSISMYPKMWEASGLSCGALLDRLIRLALDRHAAKRKLQTHYDPKKDWYKE